MTTSAATVDTNYDAAIAALELVIDNVHNASTGILATETLAAGVSAFERSVLAKAAENAKQALAIMSDPEVVNQLEGAAY